MNNKTLVLLSAFVVLSGSTVGLIAFTDVYENVKIDIVETICLSCIGKDPAPKTNLVPLTYTPDFILDNLSKAPVFIVYRSTVCSACDYMEDYVIKPMFDVEFGMKELFNDILDFKGNNLSFFHININEVSKSSNYYQSFINLDKDDRGSVPMFVIITFGEEDGKIMPFYTTVYGQLGLKDNSQKQKEFISEKLLEPAFENYDKYKDEYFKDLK